MCSSGLNIFTAQIACKILLASHNFARIPMQTCHWGMNGQPASPMEAAPVSLGSVKEVELGSSALSLSLSAPRDYSTETTL